MKYTHASIKIIICTLFINICYILFQLNMLRNDDCMNLFFDRSSIKQWFTQEGKGRDARLAQLRLVLI